MKRSIDFANMMLRDDGKTVEGRIVPYGIPTEIREYDPDAKAIKVYKEQFLQRSCLGMAQGVAKRGNAGFISFLMEHESGFDAKIGYATDLRDESDGAYATFRLYDSHDLPKVQSMLRESHTGLSVNFADVKPARLIDGVVSRVQVHIEHVAATPVPCYEHAGITAMRAIGEIPEPVTPLLDSINDWLASVGRRNA
jgi:hypothetical protein